MSIRHLDTLFHPRSVALIGASDRPGSVGAVVLRNLKEAGFTGPIWPINSHHDTVGGQPAWKDVGALPETPDLAVICTPAAAVPGLVEQLGARGTRSAIVISAGLKEQGPDGRTFEQAMLDAARPHLLRILGPNCIGLLVPTIGLNASFAPGNGLAGQLAFVTQSGALATAMLDWATERDIGFSHFISLGDAADVDLGDVLDYLGSDAGTRAVLVYAESIKAGRKFMSAARAAARNKPVIVVKSGRAPAGARAAASHTGALAGSDQVFDAAVRRAGMLRVDTLEALFDAAETLARARPGTGENVVVLTNGGGAGVLAADALSLGGGRLAQLSDATIAALDAVLPATWSHGNPVDILGDAPIERYVKALRILLGAGEVDGVLFIHAPTALVAPSDIAGACLPVLRGAGKSVLGCWLGGAIGRDARQAWTGAGIPCFGTPEHAVAAWLQMATHARNQAALQQTPASLDGFVPDSRLAQQLIDEALAAGREWLDEVQGKQLLGAYGIPCVDTRFAHDADEAAQAARVIGFPVVLKVVSPQIVHKSDVGGVALDLRSEDDVRHAAVRMRQQVARLAPGAHVQGFAVQAMARPRDGRELIVGINSDPVFGPVVLCGRGGVEVELSKQSAVALPPLNALLARDLVDRAHLGPLLAAWRGKPAADEGALLDTLQKVALLACDLAGLAELDINPLVVHPQGAIALDARVRVRPARELAAPAIRPYPQELAQDVAIGGQTLHVRPIRPEDATALARFYADASPSDMRLRFFLARREVPHSELARYAQIDYDREMTFIALDASGAMAGEVRAVCDPDNEVAEFAMQVAGPWQGKGLGRLLLRQMVDHLRSRGTRLVIGQCLPENSAMASLARHLGFAVTSEGDVVRLVLDLG